MTMTRQNSPATPFPDGALSGGRHVVEDGDQRAGRRCAQCARTTSLSSHPATWSGYPIVMPRASKIGHRRADREPMAQDVRLDNLVPRGEEQVRKPEIGNELDVGLRLSPNPSPG